MPAKTEMNATAAITN